MTSNSKLVEFLFNRGYNASGNFLVKPSDFINRSNAKLTTLDFEINPFDREWRIKFNFANTPYKFLVVISASDVVKSGLSEAFNEYIGVVK